MAKLDLAYVQRFKDRHGRLRHYFRRAGFKRVALSGSPGTVEFAASYQRALANSKPATASLTEGPRSIGAAIAEYYLSAKFKALKPSSRKGHRGVLERFRSEHGTKSALTVTAKHLNVIFHQMADRPAQASNLRKRLRAVFALVKSIDWRADNPIDQTDPLAYRAGGFSPWSEEDIAAYEARWPSGTRERLALAILLYAGVRRSDAVLTGRQHVRGNRLGVRQVKTDRMVWIPIHPALQAEIDAAPLGMTLLMTAYGKPFSPAGFTSWFVERARSAGVLERGPHGLRKAAGRRLAEAGCSGKEIAAVLGHASVAMVEVYTRDADQIRLAETAMAKVRGNETGAEVSNPFVKPAAGR